MPSPAEIEAKFWKALKSDMTMMLGLDGERRLSPADDGAAGGREGGPIWFFTAGDTELVKQLGNGDSSAFATFASKGHDLFATVKGRLVLDNDRAAIDRLWNRFVAAWFEKGKDDPKLALLRFDPAHAEIWIDARA